MADAIEVHVTMPDAERATSLARALVDEGLAACVNVARAPVESIYQWKGKVTVAREYLLVIKTTANRVPELRTEICRLHSYDLPEIITLPVDGGLAEYLAWVRGSLA